MTSTARDSALVKELGGLTEADLTLVGAKAGRLGLLRRSGHRVPDGFCVTVRAFQEALAAAGLERWWELAADERSSRVAAMKTADLQPRLDADLIRAYEALLERSGGAVLLAVRSSGILEDASANSFAGVYDSILRVDGAQALRQAVRDCWLSALTDEVLGYLARFGYEPETNGMAVLVQEMIEGDVSGVMFTANPATGNPFELCIDAVPGICEPLVSGDAAAVQLILDRENPGDEAPPHELLSGARIDRLRKLADDVERRFGGEPQDIEWGIRDDQAFILQTRPVTALPSYFPVEENQVPPGKRFKLAFVGIFSPLGCSIEVIKSRVYLDALYRATGRRLNQQQLVVNGYLYDSTTDSGGSLLRVFKIARDFLATGRVAREFAEQVVPGYLAAIAATGRRVETERGLEALVDLLAEQLEAYLEFQRHSIAVVNLANLYPRLFKRYCLIRGLTDDGLLALSLLQGEENETLRRDALFDSLCEGLRTAGPVDGVLGAASWGQARELLAGDDAGREFLEGWDAFQGQFDYTWTTGNPKDPGWQEDGSLILSSIQAALAHQGDGPAARLGRAARERAATEETMRPRLGPVGRKIFDFLLGQARRHFPVRENRNHLFYRGVAAMRTTLRRMGSVLAADGRIENVEDLFSLTYDEIRELVPAGRFEELRQLAGERRRAYDRYRRLNPPAVLGDRPAPDGAVPRAPVDGRALTGQPCSPGTVTAPARIVHTPQEMGRLRGGEVLVISKIRPYFATLLGVAGGLVTEEGSLLSHGANLAREYGIPAVLGVSGVTRAIKTGDRVTVDGTNGSVVIDDRPGES